MDFDPIIRDWAEAQVLILGPSFDGMPKAAWHVERVVADWPNVRSAVIRLLEDVRPLVVAYALRSATLARDSILLELSDSLLQSTAGITVDEGSFRTSTNLGSLARKWAKEARLQDGRDN